MLRFNEDLTVRSLLPADHTEIPEELPGLVAKLKEINAEVRGRIDARMKGAPQC